MDGSNSTTQAVASTASSNSGTIIGGVIGGTFGISLLAIFGHCIRQAIRKNRENKKTQAYAAKHPGESKQHRGATKTSVYGNNGKFPRSLPIQTARPLPGQPRKSPTIPITRPHTGNALHHETPYLNTFGAQHKNAAVSDTRIYSESSKYNNNGQKQQKENPFL